MAKFFKLFIETNENIDFNFAVYNVHNQIYMISCFHRPLPWIFLNYCFNSSFLFSTFLFFMFPFSGRPEMVVGWYHSHPGFGCWLSGVDINTQQSFEALSERAVAVVVDPIQSVKGKLYNLVI